MTRVDSSERKPHVVILGAGFGGLYATRALARAPVSVTLVDSKNHHVFQPLLYQVATAALAPSNIAVPIRRILRSQTNATVVLADALSIDTAQRRVLLDEGELDYDFLIVATGATHSYFGHDAWRAFAPGLKSIEDALDIRRRVLVAYEEAEREPDPALQKEWLTFVVVGGGPTGVELAGALAEISRHVLDHDFRRIDPKSARIVLLEAGPRILPAFSPSSSEKAKEQLLNLGAEVLSEKRVTDIDARGVTLDGERIQARTVLWAAGIKASPLAATLGVPLDGSGRVSVLPDLSVPGSEDVFVVGDLARLELGHGLVPGVAPAAMQEGRHAAKNILRRIRGQSTTPFHYLDKGSLATIGRAAAVAEFGKIHLAGLLAWLAWLIIHVLFLIGFRNRYLALWEWAWSYVTYDRGARLITGEKRETPRALP